MKRLLLNSLTALSLLLCVGTVDMWAARGGFGVVRYRFDPISQRLHRSQLLIGDQLAWTCDRMTFVGKPPSKPVQFDWGRLDEDRNRRPLFRLQSRSLAILGFVIELDGGIGQDASYVAIPSWFLTLLFAALPAMRGRAIWRERRRTKMGLCVQCGYDLRGSGERCPECGRVADHPIRSTLDVRS